MFAVLNAQAAWGLGQGPLGLSHALKVDAEIPFRFPVHIVNFKYKCSSVFINTNEDIQVWLVKGVSVSCCIFVKAFIKGKCSSFGHRVSDCVQIPQVLLGV